jgi:hypothetical protein
MTPTTTAACTIGLHRELMNFLKITKGRIMSLSTMILGESGTGKTTSLRNLAPAKTLLIQMVRKPLPFRSENWKPATKENPHGSIYVCDDSAKIVAAMKYTRKEIIVIDDFQYLLANEFMRRVTDQEVGNSAFAKYNEIARHAWDVLMAAAALPEHALPRPQRA